MAKVRPVAGFQLSGAIGGIVFCKRAGGVYARAHVVPRDPKTPAQLDRRSRFRAAVLAWRALPNPEKETWSKRAARNERTGYHLFLAEFMANANATPSGKKSG
jgi:hypothetical protein